MLKQTMIALTSAAAIGVGFAGSAEAASIVYAPDGGTLGVDFFEPIGQTFVAEDARVEAGLFFRVIFLNAPNTGPIVYQLFEGVGTSGSLLSAIEFTLTDGFEGFKLVDFSGTPLTVGNTYSLLASTDGDSPYLGISTTSDPAAGPGTPDGLRYALTVNPLEAPESVPEPASLLGLAAIGAVAAGSALKKKAAA